jgi:hypothetical protein
MNHRLGRLAAEATLLELPAGAIVDDSLHGGIGTPAARIVAMNLFLDPMPELDEHPGMWEIGVHGAP